MSESTMTTTARQKRPFTREAEGAVITTSDELAHEVRAFTALAIDEPPRGAESELFYEDLARLAVQVNGRIVAMSERENIVCTDAEVDANDAAALVAAIGALAALTGGQRWDARGSIPDTFIVGDRECVGTVQTLARLARERFGDEATIAERWYEEYESTGYYDEAD